MAKHLGPFDARVTRYVRPDQPYTCGRTGDPCLHGPGPDGRCSESDNRCIPIPSEGRQRRNMFLRVLFLTFGLALIFISADWSVSLDPGARSSAHSQFQCSQCHDPELSSTFTFMSRGLLGIGDSHSSEQCLECHDMGENAVNPHSVSPERWEKVLADGSRTLGGIASIPCARCHVEHRFESPATGLNDARCQACHQKRFPSFHKGHPEFGDEYGVPIRAIQFDHFNHANKHFMEKPDLAPDRCDHCHTLGPDGNRMRVKPFSMSCAGCHEDSIGGRGPAGKDLGFEVLAIPDIDTTTLSEAGMELGDWPFNGTEFPESWSRRWIRHALDADPSLTQLSGIELWSLEGQSEAVLNSASHLAWAYKEALLDAAEGNLESLINRMVPAAAGSLTHDETAQLAALLPRSLLVEASDAWFPHLSEEVALHRAGEDLPGKDTAPVPQPGDGDPQGEGEDVDLLGDDLLDGDLLDEDLLDEDLLDENAVDAAPSTEAVSSPSSINPARWANAGGWYRVDSSIRYRPVQHADSFLRAWATLEARTGDQDPDSAQVFAQIFSEDSPGACASCHIGLQHGGDQVRWEPDSHRAEPFPRFTHFAHGPHILSNSDISCLGCHEPAKNKDLPNDWKAVTRNQCIECHGHPVEDRCTTCHEYHAGPRIDVIGITGLDILRSPEDR